MFGPAGQLKAETAAWRCFSPFAAMVTTRLLAVLLLLALGMPNTVPTLLLLLPCMLLPTLGRLSAVRGCWEEKARLRVGNRILLPIICEAIVLLWCCCLAVSVLRRQSPHAVASAVFDGFTHPDAIAGAANWENWKPQPKPREVFAFDSNFWPVLGVYLPVS